MESSGAIHEAARRLEEAAAVFRFKARSTADDYDELAGRWTDSRAQQFAMKHIAPQRESMEQGDQLCRAHAEGVASAKSSAEAAEREFGSFFVAQDDFEMSAADSTRAAQSAKDLASRAMSVASSVASELDAINGGISAAAQDPGWG